MEEIKQPSVALREGIAMKGGKRADQGGHEEVE